MHNSIQNDFAPAFMTHHRYVSVCESSQSRGPHLGDFNLGGFDSVDFDLIPNEKGKKSLFDWKGE